MKPAAPPDQHARPDDDLLTRVIHHIEGTEKRSERRWNGSEIVTVEYDTFGPDRWIGPIQRRKFLRAIDCLALIFFVLDDWDADSQLPPTEEMERQLAEDWWRELTAAATAGEVKARDPFTLLPFTSLPDGDQWKLSLRDADRFVEARDMGWTCTEIVDYLATQVEGAAAVESRAPASLPLFRQRRDLLTPAIEAAQKRTGTPTDAAAVWAVLCEMAEHTQKPFVGRSEDGLKWTDAADRVQFLSLKNLRDRLRTQRAKAR